MILGIAGSGRSRANSTRLLEQVLAGAAATGLPGHTVRLGELSFRGCVGCLACRRGADACVLEDDLTEVLTAVRSARAVVLATPIYYGYPTGLMKSFLDRWYSLRDGARTLRMPGERPAGLIFTQGHPDPEGYAWTLQSLGKVLSGYGFLPRTLVAPGLEEAGAAETRTDLLDRALALGRELAGAAGTSGA